MFSRVRVTRIRNSFYLVVVLIQLLLVVLTFLFTRQAIDALDRHEVEKARSIAGFVDSHIEQATARAVIAVTGIVNNPAVVTAFAAKDRPALARASEGTWSTLQRIGVGQFQFHVPAKESSDFVSFLRLHEPTRFNDSLTAFRPTVVKANTTKAMVIGLEQGRAGYGFRAVAPVVSAGAMVGTVEVGFDFGNAFLALLNKSYPGHWGVYNLDRGVKSLDDRIVINVLGDGKDVHFKNVPLSEGILERVRRGEHHYERDPESRTNVLHIPLRNYLADIVLVVKHVYSTTYYDAIRDIILGAALICFIGLVLSGLIIFALYRMITAPIQKLVAETDRIKRFELDDEIGISSGLTEVQELIDAMKGMKAGLQSFRKYVPAQLVRQLIESKQEARISGLRRNITVFFSDVEGFTSISETLTPNELATRLSEYLNEMTAIILRHQGTVDKYIGDSIMAFWGAPIDQHDHAERACRAALECQARLREMAAKWQEEGKTPFHTRIGINSGEIVVGNIGSEQRFSYTAIGDAVNLASRLEGINRVYGTRIIVSQNTAGRLPDDFALRLLDFVMVRGKSEPVKIYELVAEKGDITSLDMDYLKYFNRAVALYQQRDWDSAIRCFSKLAEKRPHDPTCGMYLRRCEAFNITPPPEDWNGEYVMAG